MNDSGGYQVDRELDRVVRVVDADELTLDLFSTCLVDGAGAEPRPYSGVAEASMDWGDSPSFMRKSKVDEAEEDGVQYDRDIVALTPEPPPWRIAFTKRFCKDTAQIDRKLQGQIFETIQKLSGYSWPLKPVGDTFKPLVGELKGMWRYRIGDFRLVVKPVVANSELDLVAFAARGSVYD